MSTVEEDVEDRGSLINPEQLEEWYDYYVDVTTRVECYENGKTFKCDCGQGFGVNHQVANIRCPSCGYICVDRCYINREPPQVEEGQTTLGDWK